MQDKKKLIIIKIIGGLGNQIFQFCFAVIISKMTSRTLVVNNSRYFLSKKIKAYLKQITNNRYKNSFSKKFFFINFISNFKIFTSNYLEKNYFNITKNDIDSIVKNKKKVLLLEGYWQSFKFLDQLNSKNFLEIFNKKFTKNNKKKKSKEICVHIRRGDYYNDSKVKEIHGILKFSYFSNAILRFEKKFNDNVNLIIFSDDIDFCKRLNYLQNKNNVEFFQSSDELLTFSEMSNYKNYIISNSTYSLLAAYFSARKYGSINIAMPDEWVANVKTNSTQLISKYFNMV